MNTTTSAVLIQLLVNAVLIGISVYVAIVAQNIIETMTAYRETLGPWSWEMKERAVLDNEIKYYWIVNGISLATAALSSLNVLLMIFTSGIIGEEKKKKQAKTGGGAKRVPKRA